MMAWSSCVVVGRWTVRVGAGDGGCELVVVWLFVDCWRVGEIGTGERSCAAVEDVL